MQDLPTLNYAVIKEIGDDGRAVQRTVARLRGSGAYSPNEKNLLLIIADMDLQNLRCHIGIDEITGSGTWLNWGSHNDIFFDLHRKGECHAFNSPFTPEDIRCARDVLAYTAERRDKYEVFGIAGFNHAIARPHLTRDDDDAVLRKMESLLVQGAAGIYIPKRTYSDLK